MSGGRLVSTPNTLTNPFVKIKKLPRVTRRIITALFRTITLFVRI
jgi:hypothetical protein